MRRRIRITLLAALIAGVACLIAAGIAQRAERRAEDHARVAGAYVKVDDRPDWRVFYGAVNTVSDLQGDVVLLLWLAAAAPVMVILLSLAGSWAFKPDP